MSDLRNAARQALEAWDNDENGTMDHPLSGAMEALRVALEQPEQEPVAWASKHALARIKDFDSTIYANGGFDDAVPLYTHPTRRAWRGLKEWEINDGLDQLPTEDVCSWSFRKGVYFAEAALKERNHGYD